MITAASCQETAVVSRLLDELLTRLDGLLDTGTAVVLAGVVFDARAFINAHCEVLHSLVVEIRALLPGESARLCAASFDHLLATCERLRVSLVEWAEFARCAAGNAPLVADLRSAVAEIIGTTRTIAGQTGALLSRPDERQAYRERIFENLTSI